MLSTLARKLLERARQACLGGFRGPKQTGGTKPIVTEMWDTEEGKLPHFIIDIWEVCSGVAS